MLPEKHLKGMDNVYKNARSIIAFTVVLFCFTFLILLIFFPVPADNRGVINISAGILLGSLTGIVGYYFGSSKGKDDQDKVTQQVAQETVANQAQAQIQQAVVSPVTNNPTTQSSAQASATSPVATFSATVSPGVITKPAPVKKARVAKQKSDVKDVDKTTPTEIRPASWPIKGTVVYTAISKQGALDYIKNLEGDNVAYEAVKNAATGLWNVVVN